MASQGSNQESKARPGQRRIAQWTRDYARLPGIPDEYIGEDGGAPRGVEPVFRCFRSAVAGRYRAPLRLRRPASARGRRHLSRARRDRRPAVAAQPSAAHHRRGRLAATDHGHRPARPIVRNGAARSLWRGPAGDRWRGARGRDCRQQRISARGLRRQTARRPRIFTSMRPMSAAAPMGAGGC